MAAGDARAAFGDERELEQRAVGDRPADIDARLGGEPPLRLQRAADGASGIVAESGGIEVRKLQVRLEGERIGEPQPPATAQLAALRRRAQAAHLHAVAAPHGFRADRHAGLRQRAAHALLVAREIELQRSRERRLAQRGAQPAQIERGRAQRAAKAAGAELAAAFEDAAACELEAQLFEHGACEVLAGDARPQRSDRQPLLVDRPGRGVRDLELSLQAAIAAADADSERERGMRQVRPHARRIERRGAGFERDEVLRPERSERRLHLRGGLRLAQTEAQLEPLEGAAQRERRAEREGLVLEIKAAFG